MWTCPRCKHKFLSRNQSHSCGKYSLKKFLEGKSEKMQTLFYELLTHFESIGSFELHPVKTRVALLKLMRFAAINKIGTDFIDGHLVLTKPYEAECFRRIENLNDRFFVHHFRIRASADIKMLTRYMRLAYDVGLRKHVQVSE
jgi:hypothetical protein